MYDLNEDGKPDVFFVNTVPDQNVAGVVYVKIDNSTIKLTDGTKGNLLWQTNQTKEWEDYKYLYPDSL